MTDEQITALEQAKWWVMTLPREQFEMVLAISNEASRRGEIAGIAKERRRIVAWLRGEGQSDWVDPDCADAIEAGEHLT